MHQVRCQIGRKILPRWGSFGESNLAHIFAFVCIRLMFHPWPVLNTTLPETTIFYISKPWFEPYFLRARVPVLETWESKCDYDDGVHAEQIRAAKTRKTCRTLPNSNCNISTCNAERALMQIKHVEATPCPALGFKVSFTW